MRSVTLPDLQASVRDKTAFGSLKDYSTICRTFLSVLKKTKATRIVSPSHANYIWLFRVSSGSILGPEGSSIRT
jgi:hypothetical protein